MVKDPVYWISDTNDDYYERVYGDTTNLTHLRRDLNIKHYSPEMCGRYRFNTTALPTVSVIVTMRNEAKEMITLTTHAVLGRTPPELLVEIIIVNDSDDKDTDEMRALERVSDKVIHVPTPGREGCARSRLIGARMAKGEVLMFIDSHVEMLSSTWYQHLVLPIVENPHTLASQQLEHMGDDDEHIYKDKKSRGSHFGIMNDLFYFGYETYKFKNTNFTSAPPQSEPYEMPFGPGALFAIRKDEFWRLGGYDEGIYVWGAENMELSLKIWLCGGRLVQVPCSPTGHMYRVKDSKKWANDNFTVLIDKLHLNEEGRQYRAYKIQGVDTMTRIWLRNNIRIAKLWLGEWRHPYYKRVFHRERLSPEWLKFEEEDEFMLKQKLIQKKNQCKDFNWFDKHVLMRLLGTHNPWWNDKMPNRHDDDDAVSVAKKNPVTGVAKA